MVTGALAGLFFFCFAENQETVDYKTVADYIDASVGKSVEWFGKINNITTLDPGNIELVITQIPLSDEGVPMNLKYNQGRFIARVSMPLDTLDYRNERMVNILGGVTGGETRNFGGSAITFPVIRASKVELWDRKLPKNPYRCRNSFPNESGNPSRTNDDKFTVTCDQDGYYWTKVKTSDTLLDKMNHNR